MTDTMRDRIHPQLLEWYDKSQGFDFDHLDTFVPKANAAELVALKEDPAVTTFNKVIPGPADHPELKIRVYQPANGDGNLLKPCVIFFHGGGFLFGTVYRQENLCQRYVKNADCVVVSVEYRLAVQGKAPAPVEDGYAALCWVHDHGEEIGVDGSKIALAGLSAGGTIVAALSMLTRDRKGPQPVLQMPLYGELDHHLDTPSAREITSHKVWCYDNNRLSWDLYLDPGRPVTYIDSPALCEDLTGLPPLFSFVGQLDPVRDENIAFWNRMMQAGVPVECHVYPGCYHCFELGCPEADYSKMAYEASYRALREALGT